MPLGNQTSAHEWKMPPESRHPTGQLTFLWVLTTGASHKRVKGKNSCLILNARAWYGRVRPPIRCACGEIGRRARLRIWCREACRFESYHPHTHTVFYRQKTTKTAILVGFYCLYQGTTKKTDTVSVTFSVTWLASFLQCSLLVEKGKRH